MENKIFDVCVIGGGVNGSSAAYYLAKQSKNVLLLEQFPLPHTRGSSHGQSRIIRCLYQDYEYSKMTCDSFALWKTLQNEVNEKLLIQNGMLQIYPPDFLNTVSESCQALDKVGSRYELLKDGDAINRRFPLFNVSKDSVAIYENDGGMLLANKCVAALQKMFLLNGGILRDGERVIKLTPGNVIEINTDQAIYRAKSIIIACGSYTKSLVASLGLHLPLQATRTHACYWKLKDASTGSVNSGFPSFIKSSNRNHIYGLASYEYPGLIKICDHEGIAVDIDYPDTPPYLEEIKNVIRNIMKGVDDTPSIVESCLYTNTPDRHFIIDVHPQHTNIVIAAGFSGTGFKMAPITGQILADLSLGRHPSYDISMFRMSRFHGVIKDIKSSL